MQRYRKGANAERELLKLLSSNGFSLLRSAGSGVNPGISQPDLLALKAGKALAFECKAWNSEYLSIPLNTFDDTNAWCDNAGADFFVAWKVPNQGWLFIKPHLFKRTEKNAIVSLKKAHAKAINLDAILGLVKPLV